MACLYPSARANPRALTVCWDGVFRTISLLVRESGHAIASGRAPRLERRDVSRRFSRTGPAPGLFDPPAPPIWSPTADQLALGLLAGRGRMSVSNFRRNPK